MDVIAARRFIFTSTSAFSVSCHWGTCEHAATPCSSSPAVVLCPVSTTSRDQPCSVAIVRFVSAIHPRGSADFQAEQRIYWVIEHGELEICFNQLHA
jgi:hypothetical protein